MKILRWIVLGFISTAFIVTTASAEEAQKNLPWEKAYFNLGGQISALDTGIKLSSKDIGLGIVLDGEDTLGLDVSQTVFRVDAGWRFSDNLRHKVDFSWFRFDRTGTETLDQQIEVPDGEGGTTTLGPGELNSLFKLDIYKLKYEYSAILDDRIDLNLGLGLYIMPVELGIEGVIDGVGQNRVAEDITAPLPVLGLGFDFAITPEWFLRLQSDLFYLELGQFKGGLLYNAIAVEYLPWKNVGFGLGVDNMRLSVEADGGDYPEINFKGKFGFNYIGAMLYLKLYM